MSPSEALVRESAEAMLSNGLHAAGYRNMNLDDGWCLTDRDANGNLQPDPSGFPNGIKELAAWLKGQGFSFGVYTDRGPQTCGGRAGAQGHEAQDAAWYASMGVEYLKEDSCGASTDHQTAYSEYAKMRDGLAAAGNATGNPIFFSLCGWEAWYSPVLQALGNSARIGPDDTNYNGVLSDIDAMLPLWPHAGPGGWNDPCLLLGAGADGTDAVTEQQSRFQFSAWAVLAAPMLLSQNVRNMSAFRLATYTNPEVIAVSQDAMGRQGALLGGGPLSIAPRSLTAHLERRFGKGKLPDPRKVYSKKQLAELRGSRWGDDNDAPLTPLPCTGASTQQWKWNISAPGYLTNVGTQLCANVGDCGSELIAYTCVTTGGTCLGPNDYDGLVFQLAADGTLRTPGSPGQCIQHMGAGVQLSLQPCAPGNAAQQWAYNQTSLALYQPGSSSGCITVGGGSSVNSSAIIGRPLSDGSMAIAFLNAGLAQQDMSCDEGCLSSITGWEPEQVLSVRDLWARVDLPDITVAGGLAAGTIAADGGVALIKVTPKFNATSP